MMFTTQPFMNSANCFLNITHSIDKSWHVYKHGYLTKLKGFPWSLIFFFVLPPDSCSDSECCEVSPGDMVVDADSWEENWLFRRHRLAGNHTSDPVTMLIPNPEDHVTPTVGNRSVWFPWKLVTSAHS